MVLIGRKKINSAIVGDKAFKAKVNRANLWATMAQELSCSGGNAKVAHKGFEGYVGALEAIGLSGRELNVNGRAHSIGQEIERQGVTAFRRIGHFRSHLAES